MRKLSLFFVTQFAIIPTAAIAAEIACKAGYYVPANTTTCMICPNSYYCTGGTFSQSATDQGLTQCPPIDDSTRRTTFSDKLFPYNAATNTYDRSGGITITRWAQRNWGSGWPDISYCRAYYRLSTAGSKQVNTDGVSYNPISGKYDIDDESEIYYEDVNSGYYLDTPYFSSYCDTPTNHMLYRRAVICPAGSYCPGITYVPECGSGAQPSEMGRIDCPSGAYCPPVSSAPTPCPAGTYSAAIGATDANTCTKCTDATYSDTPGATECTPCPTATALADRVTRYWYWSENDVHDYADGCRASFVADDFRGDYNLSCHLCNGDYGVDDSCSKYACQAGPINCVGGYWWMTEWSSGNPNRHVNAPNIEKIKDVACVPVRAGYWSANGDLTRTACTTGQTTIGYGPGADESGDCGHALHIGNRTLYLRSNKKTTPSLNVKIGDTIFYGNMSESELGTIRINTGATTYSVYDDSM